MLGAMGALPGLLRVMACGRGAGVPAAGQQGGGEPLRVAPNANCATISRAVSAAATPLVLLQEWADADASCSMGGRPQDTPLLRSLDDVVPWMAAAAALRAALVLAAIDQRLAQQPALLSRLQDELSPQGLLQQLTRWAARRAHAIHVFFSQASLLAVAPSLPAIRASVWGLHTMACRWAGVLAGLPSADAALCLGACTAWCLGSAAAGSQVAVCLFTSHSILTHPCGPAPTPRLIHWAAADGWCRLDDPITTTNLVYVLSATLKAQCNVHNMLEQSMTGSAPTCRRAKPTGECMMQAQGGWEERPGLCFQQRCRTRGWLACAHLAAVLPLRLAV